MPPGSWLNFSSSRAWSMRVPIFVVDEIWSSEILRFSRSSRSFSPKDGKASLAFVGRNTEFYSDRRRDHRGIVAARKHAGDAAVSDSITRKRPATALLR